MLTQNQFNTAGALSVLQQSGEPLRLYNNLLILDAASARNAADQLSGDYHSSTSTALIANSQVVSGVLGTRVRNLLDSGTLRMPAMALNLMPSTPAAENGAWVQPFGNWTKVDGNNGVPIGVAASTPDTAVRSSTPMTEMPKATAITTTWVSTPVARSTPCASAPTLVTPGTVWKASATWRLPGSVIT